MFDIQYVVCSVQRTFLVCNFQFEMYHVQCSLFWGEYVVWVRPYRGALLPPHLYPMLSLVLG